jgi:ABC-type nickel/cobalt efflux system permease component RcnA
MQSSFLQIINRFQRRLYDHIAGTMQAVKSHENRGSVLFAALGAAFLYGLLHALGPGHRKTVIFSYFLAEDAPVLQGVLAGVLMALLHGAAAVGLILPIYYILRGSLMITFNSVSRYIEIATFGFIAVFGAMMLTLHLVHLLRGRHAHHAVKQIDQREDIGIAGAAQPSAQHLQQRNLLLLVIGSGLVPCPGAAMVLMFALSMQMLTLGLLAVGAMSLGMAVTISSVAVVTLGARNGLRKTAAKNQRLTTILHNSLEIGGYLVIFLFGIIMTLGML